MKVNASEYEFKDILSLLKNPFIQSLEPLSYGKAIQSAVEEYVTTTINSICKENILLKVEDDDRLIEKFQYSNNGPGFDRLLKNSLEKIQIKFRQVNGKTPFSKQIHFENTRRHSEKNKNNSADTGLIRYGINEFDYAIIVMCHIVDGVRTKFDEWSFSLIKSESIEDVNNRGYCLPKIPSHLLLQNKYDNIYMLADKLKSLNKVIND